MVIKDSDPGLLPKVVKILKNQGIVIMKCDTIYGIVGIAPSTREKIKSIKKRDSTKQFLMLIQDGTWLKKFSNQRMPPDLKKYWPGPLTLVFVGKKSGSIALRVPQDSLLRTILKQIKKPLYSTSVNLANEAQIDNIDEIVRRFGSSVDCIVDSGTLTHALPSTIIDVTQHPYRVIRQGSLEIPASLLGS
jgi:L-threonylcarbamoyladenylate synthase